MKNVLFDKKFTETQQTSYMVGWDKALKAYQEVMVEDFKEKIGLKSGKILEFTSKAGALK